jgi:hypothetical protein
MGKGEEKAFKEIKKALTNAPGSGPAGCDDTLFPVCP